MMQCFADDDTPKPPDPAADDWMSGQARRALELQLQLPLEQSEQITLPIPAIH